MCGSRTPIKGFEASADIRPAKQVTLYSLLSALSYSDIDNLTNLYIKAKDNGIDTSTLEILAVRTGDINNMKRLGIQYYSEAEWVIDDAASPPEGIPDSIAENAKKLYGQFGMSNMLVNSLAAGYSRPTDAGGRQEVFKFLLEMMAIDASSTK